VTLLPLTATAGGAALVALPDAERGRRLFVAKGCVTCHLHRDLDMKPMVAIGPELTERRYPAEYLRQFLADPPPAASSKGMPDLNLKPAEIAALTSFINMERQAAR